MSTRYAMLLVRKSNEAVAVIQRVEFESAAPTPAMLNDAIAQLSEFVDNNMKGFAKFLFWVDRYEVWSGGVSETLTIKGLNAEEKNAAEEAASYTPLADMRKARKDRIVRFLREHGDSTRRQIARASKMSQPLADVLVEQLVRERIIGQVGCTMYFRLIEREKFFVA